MIAPPSGHTHRRPTPRERQRSDGVPPDEQAPSSTGVISRVVRKLMRVSGATGAVLCAGGALTHVLTRRGERRYPPRGRFVVVEGVRLHIVDLGPTAADPGLHGPDLRPTAPDPEARGPDREPPTVVLIHGLKGSSAELTYSIADRLAERYRVLAIDRPGYGFSDAAPHPAGAPRIQARLLRGALRQLDVERPILVGHSLGAALVMAYVVEYPDEAGAGVTLSGHTLPFDGPFGGTSRIAGLPFVGPLLVHTLVTPLGLLAGQWILRAAVRPQKVPREYVRAAVVAAVRPRAFFAGAADIRDCDADMRRFFTRYPAVQTPFVLVAAGADRHISPNESLSLYRLLPHSELREIDGSGHMPFFADPDAVIAAIDRAAELARHAGDAPAT